MKFPDSYFEDEVREGFYIPDMMKRAWAAQAEVLRIIQDICKKHDIRYFAEWGTLLGAIRHGGRIPWDDDVDVCMLREDYNKFRKAAKIDLPEECWFMDNQVAEGFENTVSLLINSRYHVVQDKYLEKYHGCPYVESVDVFCLDYVPTDETEAAEHRHRLRVLYALLDRLKQTIVSAEELEFYLKKTEEEHHMKFNRNKPIRPQLYDLIERVCMKYNRSNATEVSNIPVWLEDPNYHMAAGLFSEGVVVPYDTIDIVVPCAYDELLSKKYGSGWMTPIRSGGSHVYPVYSKQERFLRENQAADFFEFSFSQKEYDEVEASRQPKETLRSRVEELLPLFPEAHAEIQKLLYDGAWEDALTMLGECQEVAVQLGTMVEENLGEKHDIVKQLEQYCEVLFQINQSLMSADEQNVETVLKHISQELQDAEVRISTSVERGINGKNEVVFVPYKACFWRTMHQTWQKAMDDPDTDVYVIPAPYYYKDVFGNADKEQQYDLTGYPEEVTLTSYEEYNFEIHHPDQIFIQCPYDEYNFAMTIHPFFYAANLWQYTEQIIYVPGLAVGEITAGDERAKKMLKYYCNMPGVILSDKVLVSSENMKEIYLELLTDFAGEDTEQIWQERIVVDVSPENGRSKNLAVDIPAQWEQYIRKKNGQRKKVILYTTSASALLADGEKMIEKMKYVLQTFYDNREEITLIWRSDQAVRGLLRKKNPKLWRLYSELVQQYRQEDWGIFDDQPDDASARNLCDACYGDGGRTMNGCRVDGKPVMIQNVDVVY